MPTPNGDDKAAAAKWLNEQFSGWEQTRPSLHGKLARLLAETRARANSGDAPSSSETRLWPLPRSK